MTDFRKRIRPGTPEFDDLVNRMIFQESRGNPRAFNRSSGASGLAQVMPDTARAPGFGVRPMDWSKRFDPQESRRFGRDYLGAMLNRYDGRVDKALAAYNWGPGHADKWGGDPGRLPAETRGYIANITQNRAFGNPTYGPNAYRGMAGARQASQGGQNAAIQSLIAEGEWLTPEMQGPPIPGLAEGMENSWSGFGQQDGSGNPMSAVQSGSDPAATAKQMAMQRMQELRQMAMQSPGPSVNPPLRQQNFTAPVRSQVDAPKVQSGYKPLQAIGMPSATDMIR